MFLVLVMLIKVLPVCNTMLQTNNCLTSIVIKSIYYNMCCFILGLTHFLSAIRWSVHLIPTLIKLAEVIR